MTAFIVKNNGAPNLSQIDQEIGRIRQTMGVSDQFDDVARYEIEELLDMRRKLVLGQFRTKAVAA